MRGVNNRGGVYSREGGGGGVTREQHNNTNLEQPNSPLLPQSLQ